MLIDTEQLTPAGSRFSRASATRIDVWFKATDCGPLMQALTRFFDPRRKVMEDAIFSTWLATRSER